jgi:GGDEF domain-containing protein
VPGRGNLAAAPPGGGPAATGLLGRYGGDEFVLCLRATDEDGARQILQQRTAAST